MGFIGSQTICNIQCILHHYDWLWERNSRGQGLKKCTGKPSTPRGFLLSHCVYIFEKDQKILLKVACIL